MRGAGCIINDIIDKDIDKQVERTKNRPIADGRISVVEGVVTFILMSLIGLCILIQFSSEAIVVGIVAMVLLATYPIMKRITFWPQLYLGFAFNIGVIIATVNFEHSISLEAIILYAGCILWTLYYDTLYAFADISDDKKIGVKSLAVWLEDRDYKRWLAGFVIGANSLVFIAMSMSYHDLPASIYCTLLTTAIMLHQIKHLDINNPKQCIKLFNLNVYIGVIWALMSLFAK
jgi:4-hydroxybenzoate polyprenyltransferase